MVCIIQAEGGFDREIQSKLSFLQLMVEHLSLCSDIMSCYADQIVTALGENGESPATGVQVTGEMEDLHCIEKTMRPRGGDQVFILFHAWLHVK